MNPYDGTMFCMSCFRWLRSDCFDPDTPTLHNTFRNCKLCRLTRDINEQQKQLNWDAEWEKVKGLKGALSNKR
jgi:hypothetical protein